MVVLAAGQHHHTISSDGQDATSADSFVDWENVHQIGEP